MNVTVLPDLVPILLVDDRKENLLSLEALLSDQGYTLVKATSGNEALCLTLKQEFALVLLDVQMPGMDGFETAELMRINPKTKHIPIIFVTAGMRDLQFQFRGYDTGAVDYLAKPIEPLFLQSKVRVFAELYRQRHDLELHKNHLEEIVKTRMAEFIETRDQLLVTEEMLRVQIEEYECAQKLLNESNISLQTIFDVSPLAIVVFSFPDGTIRKINQAFSNDIGCNNEQIVGKTLGELDLWTGTDDLAFFLNLMNSQPVVSGFATEIKNFHGEKRNVLLYCNPLEFKGENCLLCVMLDVTEQKRMEDQIRQTQKMDVIGQLAGGVAHDFNNMLTAILGSAELMERHVKDDASTMKLLGTIQKAAIRSADLTSQLLAFSRKGLKNAVQVSIDATINDVVSLLERTIDKKITLEKRLLASNTFVNGDPSLLQNALLNLAVNARDAMPDGGIIKFATANVELNSSHCKSSTFSITPGPYIEISVSDTGTGMTEETIRQAFEPFFTTKEVGKGTGLGLAAVYGTVTDHLGCVNIYSELGTGTLFKLYLPLCGEQKNEDVTHEELIHGSCGILLVDDEEILREVGQAQLESLGYQVYLAEHGEQALEVYALESENISLVILDMLMPIMGGKETLIKLMGSDPDVRVLISSGFHQEGTLKELEALGAKGFLQKPYIRQELCTAVAETISGQIKNRAN